MAKQTIRTSVATLEWVRVVHPDMQNKEKMALAINREMARRAGLVTMAGNNG